MNGFVVALMISAARAVAFRLITTLASAMRLARGLDGVDPERSVTTFAAYMDHGGHNITRALFEKNMHQKLKDPQFTADISPLLANGYSWDISKSAEAVITGLIQRLPGEPWKGG